MPLLDRQRAAALAQSVTGREAEARLDLVLELLDLALARLVRAGATGGLDPQAAPGEAAHFARLAPGPRAARAWATRAQEVMARARHGRAVNLDPGALILDTLLKLSELAGRTTA
jgi:DNA polymerase-3 subunit delta'